MYDSQEKYEFSKKNILQHSNNILYAAYVHRRIIPKRFGPFSRRRREIKQQYGHGIVVLSPSPPATRRNVTVRAYKTLPYTRTTAAHALIDESRPRRTIIIIMILLKYSGRGRTRLAEHYDGDDDDDGDGLESVSDRNRTDR